MNTHTDRSLEFRLDAARRALHRWRVREAEAIAVPLAAELRVKIARADGDIVGRLRFERLRIEALLVVAQALDAQWRHREGLGIHMEAMRAARAAEGPWSLGFARCFLAHALARARWDGECSHRLWRSARGLLLSHGGRGQAFDPSRDGVFPSADFLQRSGVWTTGADLVEGEVGEVPSESQWTDSIGAAPRRMFHRDSWSTALRKLVDSRHHSLDDSRDGDPAEEWAANLQQEALAWARAGESGCLDVQWLLWSAGRGMGIFGHGPSEWPWAMLLRSTEPVVVEARARWAGRLEALWRRGAAAGMSPALRLSLAIDLARLRVEGDLDEDVRRVTESFRRFAEQVDARTSRWSPHAGADTPWRLRGIVGSIIGLCEDWTRSPVLLAMGPDSPMHATIAAAVSELLTRSRSLTFLDGGWSIGACSSMEAFRRCSEFVQRFAPPGGRADFDAAWRTVIDRSEVDSEVTWTAIGCKPPDGGLLRWTRAEIDLKEFKAMLVRGEKARARAILWFAETGRHLGWAEIAPAPEAEVAFWRDESPDLSSAIDAAMLHGAGEFVAFDASDSWSDRSCYDGAYWCIHDWLRSAVAREDSGPNALAEMAWIRLNDGKPAFERTKTSEDHETLEAPAAISQVDLGIFVEHFCRCSLGMIGRPHLRAMHESRSEVFDAIRRAARDADHLAVIERIIEDWSVVLESFESTTGTPSDGTKGQPTRRP